MRTLPFTFVILGILCSSAPSSSARGALLHHYLFNETPGTTPIVDSGTSPVGLNLLDGAIQVATGPSAVVPNAINAGDNGGRATIYNPNGVPGAGTGGVTGLTIAAWFNLNRRDRVHIIAAVDQGHDNTGGLNRIQIAVANDNTVRVLGRKGETGFSIHHAVHATTPTPIVVSEWYHLVGIFRYDTLNSTNGSGHLYLNGMPLITQPFNPFEVGTTIAPIEPNGIAIGTSNARTGGQSIDGRIASVRIYDEALDDAAVLAIYNAEAVPEPSGWLLLLVGTIAGLYFGRQRVTHLQQA